MITFFFEEDMKKSHLLVLIIACLSQPLLAELNNQPWQPILGRDYQELTSTQSATETKDNNVNTIKFYFWAGSSSSYQLEVALQNWLKINNSVTLQRIPLVKRPGWRLLAKTWLAVEQLPNAEAFLTNLYRTIHIDQTKILSFDDLLPLIQQQNIEESEFKTLFHSLAINQQLNTLEKAARLFPIHTVPTIIINNRWSIDASNMLSADQFVTIIESLTTISLPLPLPLSIEQ